MTHTSVFFRTLLNAQWWILLSTISCNIKKLDSALIMCLCFVKLLQEAAIISCTSWPFNGTALCSEVGNEVYVKYRRMSVIKGVRLNSSLILSSPTWSSRSPFFMKFWTPFFLQRSHISITFFLFSFNNTNSARRTAQILSSCSRPTLLDVHFLLCSSPSALHVSFLVLLLSLNFLVLQ